MGRSSASWHWDKVVICKTKLYHVFTVINCRKHNSMKISLGGRSQQQLYIHRVHRFRLIDDTCSLTHTSKSMIVCRLQRMKNISVSFQWTMLPDKAKWIFSTEHFGTIARTLYLTNILSKLLNLCNHWRIQGCVGNRNFDTPQPKLYPL